MPPDYVARPGGDAARRPARPVASWARRWPPSAGGEPDFVAVDMGGTSFDICLVRGGRPEIKTDWNWRYRYYIGLPMVDVQSVGAGGGSIARVRQGALLVGPESRRLDARARSATAAAATRPTVTDADAVLGYLPADGFAGGRMTLDVDAARAAIDREVAEPLGLDVDRRRLGHRAHRQRQHGQRHPPGARGLRRRPPRPGAHRLRRQRRGARVGRSPPSSASTASSCRRPRRRSRRSACSSPTTSSTSSARTSTPLSQVDLGRLRDLDARAARRGRQGARAGRPRAAADVDRQLFVQMCYPGQNFDMSVPVPEGDGPRRHRPARPRRAVPRPARARPGLRLPQPAAAGPRGPPDRPGRRPRSPSSWPPAPSPPRPCLRRAGPCTSAPTGSTRRCYAGPAVATGTTIVGPALVEEPFTVVVVPPGWSATLADHAAYELRR